MKKWKQQRKPPNKDEGVKEGMKEGGKEGRKCHFTDQELRTRNFR